MGMEAILFESIASVPILASVLFTPHKTLFTSISTVAVFSEGMSKSSNPE